MIRNVCTWLVGLKLCTLIISLWNLYSVCSSVEFHEFLSCISQIAAPVQACFSVSVTHKQSVTLGCIVMCDHPQAPIDSTRKWQQAAGPFNSNGKLFVCVFMWSVRPEWPSVADCPPQPEKTRQNRTSHFSNPLWLNSLFSHPLPLELPCLPVWATSWCHGGLQTQQLNKREPGVRQWGGVVEQVKRGATTIPLIKS